MEPTKRRRKPAPLKDYTCQFCGEPFQSSGPKPKYCDSKCRDKARYANNRDKRLEAVRAYRARPDYPEKARRYRQENRERFRAHSRAAYQRNREQRIADAIAYQAAHPEVVALTRSRRRAAVSYKVSQRDHRRLLARFGHKCAYCCIDLGPWGRAHPNSLQWDHVVPLSRGGADGPGNIVPSCRKCNASKSNLLLIEWKNREIARLEGENR